jgi:hypothetical protein
MTQAKDVTVKFGDLPKFRWEVEWWVQSQSGRNLSWVFFCIPPWVAIAFLLLPLCLSWWAWELGGAGQHWQNPALWIAPSFPVLWNREWWHLGYRVKKDWVVGVGSQYYDIFPQFFHVLTCYNTSSLFNKLTHVKQVDTCITIGTKWKVTMTMVMKMMEIHHPTLLVWL